jgi:hypothetical protein
MSTHEDFSREAQLKGSSDRSFGIVFAIFFTLIGLAPLRTYQVIRWWALAVAALFLALALLRPAWLHPLNRIWTRLGWLLGRVVSPIIMALLFFVVMTPTALLFRWLGKDPLRLAPHPEADTYWIDRHPAGPKPETMTNQF